MTCKNCGKEKSELFYIMNPRCGWCTKSDPVVEELRNEGYKITTLDMSTPEDANRASEIKTKHDVQCGTPLFIDGNSGNMVCGFREKDALEPWAKGEPMKKPESRPAPSPKGAAGVRERPDAAPSGPINTKLEYIWLDGSTSKKLRSKVIYQMLNSNILSSPKLLMQNLHESTFDGPDSELILKPMRIVLDGTSTSMNNNQPQNFVVLCEVFNDDGTPHKTNTRAALRESLKENDQNMRFSIDQEYVLFNPDTEYPEVDKKLQENYYCGVGFDLVRHDQVADMHVRACNMASLQMLGTNVIMLGHWAYQTKELPPIEAADNLWFSRFFLQRIAGRFNLNVSYDPKPMYENWRSSNAHIKFSTKEMRESPSVSLFNMICSSLEPHHKEAVLHYGENNKKGCVDNFTWGENDRSVSIKIPCLNTNEKVGYIEDRRPAANMDPYEALKHLNDVMFSINEELMVTT